MLYRLGLIVLGVLFFTAHLSLGDSALSFTSDDIKEKPIKSDRPSDQDIQTKFEAAEDPIPLPQPMPLEERTYQATINQPATLQSKVWAKGGAKVGTQIGAQAQGSKRILAQTKARVNPIAQTSVKKDSPRPGVALVLPRKKGYVASREKSKSLAVNMKKKKSKHPRGYANIRRKRTKVASAKIKTRKLASEHTPTRL